MIKKLLGALLIGGMISVNLYADWTARHTFYNLTDGEIPLKIKIRNEGRDTTKTLSVPARGKAFIDGGILEIAHPQLNAGAPLKATQFRCNFNYYSNGVAILDQHWEYEIFWSGVNKNILDVITKDGFEPRNCRRG